ncbi:unnamed protein product [Boreogadus saida]
MGKKRQEERQEGDQETLCGDPPFAPRGNSVRRHRNSESNISHRSSAPCSVVITERSDGRHLVIRERAQRPEEEDTPDLDPPPPHRVSTSSQKKDRLRQVVIRWMETIEEANDPDPGQTPPDEDQTAPDPGQTAPDPGQTPPDEDQTAPEQGQTAPDRGQTPPDEDQTAPEQGQTAPDRDQTAPDPGQTAPDRGQTAPDRGQTAPDRGQTAPDRGQTAPDRGQTAPDPGQTAPDPGQTAPDGDQTAPDGDQTPDEPEAQHQGEGSGPLVAWLPPTADGPPRKDLAQVMGNLKVRVKGVRKLRAQTATMDPGQTAQDPNQLPNVPDSPPTKALAQVVGNLRFRVKGLKKKTAPDPSQIPEEPEAQHQGEGSGPLVAWLPPTADGPPRKDLAQVVGNLKVRVKGVRKLRAQTATMDPGQTAQDPNQLPNNSPPHKALAQVVGKPEFRVKGLKKKTAPDPSQIPEEPDAQHQGEGSGPLVAWLPPTADGPPRKDLAQVVGNLKVRVKGVRKLRAQTATMDPGQTAQDPNQLPNVPDSPPTKALAQVVGTLRFRVKGLKKLRVQQATTSRLDEEKPLGRPSGRSPFPGQTAPDRGQTAPDRGQTAPDRGKTAPDRGQTAPDRGQTAPDRGQTPEEPADGAPTKDLSRVLGNMRVRVRALRKQRVETATTALTEQEEEEKPLGRPSRQNPFRRIKMAWADPKAVITTDAEEGEATAQAEGTGLRPRVNKWLNRRMKEMSTFAARFQCGSCVH